MTGIAERLTEITWECYHGNFDTLRRLVKAAGGEIRDENGWLWVRAAHGMTLGVPQGGDPITVCVQVAFALLGPWWALMPETKRAMKLVNKQWRERAKKRKAAKKATRGELEELAA